MSARRRWPYVAWVACLHEWPFGGSVITCSRNNERLILSSYLHPRLLSSSVTTYRPFVLLPFQPAFRSPDALWLFDLSSRARTARFSFSFFFLFFSLLPSSSPPASPIHFVCFCLLFPLPIVSTTFCRRAGGRGNNRSGTDALHSRCTPWPLSPSPPSWNTKDKDLCRTGEAWEAEAGRPNGSKSLSTSLKPSDSFQQIIKLFCRCAGQPRASPLSIRAPGPLDYYGFFPHWIAKQSARKTSARHLDAFNSLSALRPCSAPSFFRG